jgi:hypothetical protein
MECSQIRAILFENTDTEIPAELREDVDAHLAVCSSCAMWLEALREQANALESLPKVPAPDDFLQRVRSRVERPSVLSRLAQELSGLFAGKRFFQLAGAAATAVLVIVAAQVVLRDGGRKALRPPAPSSVESSKSAASQPSAVAPQAPTPPPVAEPHRLAGVETQSVILTIKPSGASVKRKPGGGAFRPESIAAPRANAAKMSAQSERSPKGEVSKGTGGAAKVPEGGAAFDTPSTQQISSDVIRLIERANGKVLSAVPAPDDSRHEAVLAEMPAANYPSFLDQLRRLGEVESSGDKEFSFAPESNVRVSVSVDTRD